MNIQLDYYHYAMLALVTVAAFVFAWFGKIDVSVAFGIAGTAVGITIPTATPPKP